MVTKKSLISRIESLEEENKKLKRMLIKSLTALNKKISKHIKDEKNEESKTEDIKSWLEDERVDEVQTFLHKGVKQ